MARNKYADYLKARKMLPVELNMGVASDMPEPIEFSLPPSFSING